MDNCQGRGAFGSLGHRKSQTDPYSIIIFGLWMEKLIFLIEVKIVPSLLDQDVPTLAADNNLKRDVALHQFLLDFFGKVDFEDNFSIIDCFTDSSLLE